MGLYIAKRTERDGILIAYEGEAMSTEEAERRGLIKPEPKPEPKKAPAKKTTTRKTAAKKAPAKKAKEA